MPARAPPAWATLGRAALDGEVEAEELDEGPLEPCVALTSAADLSSDQQSNGETSDCQYEGGEMRSP